MKKILILLTSHIDIHEKENNEKKVTRNKMQRKYIHNIKHDIIKKYIYEHKTRYIKMIEG